MPIDIPGANVRAFGIRLPQMTRKVGPIEYKKEAPIVVFVEQGMESAGKDRHPVLVGTGNLKVGGEPPLHNEGIESEDGIPKDVPKQHSIKHLIIGLDTSSSMSEPLGPGHTINKIQHVKNQIQTLKNIGLPDNTLITLIVFNTSAEVAKDKSKREFQYRTDLKTLLQIISDLNPVGGTSIKSMLDLASIKFQHDFDPKKDRGFFLGITDGQDTSATSKIQIYNSASRIRDLNCCSVYLGIGAGYDQSMIYDLASNGGFSLWGHSPLPDKTNIFNSIIPLTLDNIQSSDFYEILTSKDVCKGFPITPSMRSVIPASGILSDYMGYQKNAISVFTTTKDDPEINLHLGDSVLSEKTPDTTYRVQIIDINDAPSYGLGEFPEKARSVWANLLKLQAILSRDPASLDKVANEFSDVIDRTQANDLSRVIRSGRIDDETVMGLYTEVSETSASQTMFIPRTRGPVPVNQYSNMGGEDIDVNKADLAKDSHSVDSGDASNAHPELHSGHVGPLSAPAPSVINPIKSPDQINPLAYGNPGNTISFNLGVSPLSLIRNPASLNNPITLRDGDEVIVGRSEACNIKVNLQAVSKKHFSIKNNSGELFVIDLDSQNGTFLNGQELNNQSHSLKDGDKISASKVIFTLKIN